MAIFLPRAASRLIYSIPAIRNYSASSIAPISVLVSKHGPERQCLLRHSVIVRDAE